MKKWSSRSKCINCRRDLKEDAETERERAISEFARKIQVDSQILFSPNPLNLKFFTDHLETYVSYWLTGEARQWSWFMTFRIGNGCMICNSKPVRLLVTTSKTFNEREGFLKLAQELVNPPSTTRYVEDSEVLWPELISPAQALWRMTPEAYFSAMPHFPLIRMPLVILCADCMRDIFKTTHIEVVEGLATRACT